MNETNIFKYSIILNSYYYLLYINSVEPLLQRRKQELQSCENLSHRLEVESENFQVMAKKVKRKKKYPWLHKLGKMCSQGTKKDQKDEEEDIDGLIEKFKRS